MQTSKRIEEELMLSEKEAISEYGGITKVIGITYCLLADKILKMVNFSKGIILDLGTGLGDLAIEIAKRFPDSSLKVVSKRSDRFNRLYLNIIIKK